MVYASAKCRKTKYASTRWYQLIFKTAKTKRVRLRDIFENSSYVKLTYFIACYFCDISFGFTLWYSSDLQYCIGAQKSLANTYEVIEQLPFRCVCSFISNLLPTWLLCLWRKSLSIDRLHVSSVFPMTVFCLVHIMSYNWKHFIRLTAVQRNPCNFAVVTENILSAFQHSTAPVTKYLSLIISSAAVSKH